MHTIEAKDCDICGALHDSFYTNVLITIFWTIISRTYTKLTGQKFMNVDTKTTFINNFSWDYGFFKHLKCFDLRTLHKDFLGIPSVTVCMLITKLTAFGSLFSLVLLYSGCVLLDMLAQQFLKDDCEKPKKNEHCHETRTQVCKFHKKLCWCNFKKAHRKNKLAI